MVVRIALEFRAKLNPDVDDPQVFETVAFEVTFVAANATDYLEKVLGAIRDRRLYGLMTQESAESSVGSGEWIAMTIDDFLAEVRKERAEKASPNDLSGDT